MKTNHYLNFFTIFFMFFSIVIFAQEEEKWNVEVEVLSYEELMKMAVTSASKFEESINQTPAPIIVLTAKDIRERGYTNLTEILGDLPGFDVIQAFGDATQLSYARGNRTGSLNERTMIQINGIEHNMLYTQHMAIENDFPITSIERIEVLYGPASAVYGANAFSGIINIISKSATDLENNSHKVYTNFGVGSFDTKYGEMTFLGKYSNIGLSVSYRRYNSDRFNLTDREGYFKEGEIIGNEDVWGPFAEIYPEYQNDADDYSLLTQLNIDNFEFGLNILSTRHGNGGVYPYDKTLPTVEWSFFREIYYAKYDNEITDDLIYSFQTNFHSGGAGPDAVWAQGWHAGNSWDDQRTVEMLTWKFQSEKWNILNDFVFSASENWILNGGLKYSKGTYQKGYELGRADQVIFDPGDREYDYDNLFPTAYPEGFNPGNTFRDSEWGGYLQVKYTSDEKDVNLVAGARYDDNDLYGDSFNPRVGATFQATEKILLKSNFGTAFQAPAPRNLFAGWGGLEVNENLSPDEITNFDFSAIYTSSTVLNDVTFFYNKIENSILQGINLPKKSIWGIEYKFNYMIGEVKELMKNAQIHINYTFTNAKYDEVRENNALGRSSDLIGGIAEHKFNIVFTSQMLKLFNFHLRANYVGERPTTISNPIESVDPYFVINSGVALKDVLKEGFEVFFNIYNLFDTDYYHPGYDSASAGEDLSHPSNGWYSSRLPQPGRYIMAGIRYNVN